MSNYTLILLTLRFYNKNISAKIKAKFDLEPHLWLINVVVNIIYYKKNVFGIASTNTGKNLSYKSISNIIRGIVLVISPIIVFMMDQT